MKKKFIIISLLLISSTVIGCSSKTAEADKNQNTNQQSQVQQTEENQKPNIDENFSQVSINDLELGQQVLVLGTEDDGGNISANRIIVGNKGINFEELRRNASFREDGQAGVGENGDVRPDQSPAGMSDFQNMSEEERAKFREEMMAQRGEGLRSGNFNGNQTIVNLQGEIIKKDETSLTLKVVDGGSKFIFFSESTVVLKVKE